MYVCVYVCMYVYPEPVWCLFWTKGSFWGSAKKRCSKYGLVQNTAFSFSKQNMLFVQCKDIMYANVTIHNQEGIEYKSEAPRTQTLADDSTQALKPCTFA
jgi:hypothetical protein